MKRYIYFSGCAAVASIAKVQKLDVPAVESQLVSNPNHYG